MKKTMKVIGEILGGIILFGLIAFIFLAVCAITDYHWVPIQ